MEILKEALSSPPILRPLVSGEGLLVILTVDASPFAAGWAVGQDDSEGQRCQMPLQPIMKFNGLGATNRVGPYPVHCFFC
jgi:hypothetical protein